MENRGRIRYVFENPGNDNKTAQLVVQMTVFETIRNHFSPFDHGDGHRLFHSQRSVSGVSQWHNLEFP